MIKFIIQILRQCFSELRSSYVLKNFYFTYAQKHSARRNYTVAERWTTTKKTSTHRYTAIWKRMDEEASCIGSDRIVFIWRALWRTLHRELLQYVCLWYRTKNSNKVRIHFCYAIEIDVRNMFKHGMGMHFHTLCPCSQCSQCSLRWISLLLQFWCCWCCCYCGRLLMWWCCCVSVVVAVIVEFVSSDIFKVEVEAFSCNWIDIAHASSQQNENVVINGLNLVYCRLCIYGKLNFTVSIHLTYSACTRLFRIQFWVAFFLCSSSCRPSVRVHLHSADFVE